MTVNEFYLGYFGLEQRPFTLLPDPEFLYWSEQHRKGYAVLEYGIMSRAPITVLTGEIGAGKTTLLQKLLDETLIRVGNEYLFSGVWWVVIFPSLTLVALVLAVNLLGDWLRDALNPRLQ